MYGNKKKARYLSVGAPCGRKVYNLYITFICAGLTKEYNIICARNGHHYIVRSLRGKNHKRTILIYQLKSGVYNAACFDELGREACFLRFAREQAVVFWILELTRNT
jgi:hypothetical protein